ncbi:MAG: hypothetical protein GY705_24870 [Bacteroidetes bacterium]|nr:hypothetical protein [Bacteroidota bacterium]
MIKRNFIINSFGGCGSKFLVKQIARYVGRRDFNKYHSHVRYPTIENMRNYQYPIVIYCDPIDAIISFFQRRYKITEQHGFKSKNKKGNLEWVVRHCKNIQGDHKAIESSWDLADFASHQQDYFLLDEFLNNWLEFSKKVNTLFVRYEEMWDNIERISKFLDFDHHFNDQFEAQKERTSRRLSISDEILSTLQRTYEPTYKIIEKIENRRVEM